MIAFILGTWIPVFAWRCPVGQNGSKAAVYLLSRSRIRYSPWCGVLQIHDQISGHLGGPGCGGVCGRAEDADTPGGMFDDGEDEQPRSAQGAGFEEVGGKDGARLAAQEGGPGEVVAVGCGLDAGVLRISQTVEGATLMASVASSPWILR